MGNLKWAMTRRGAMTRAGWRSDLRIGQQLARLVLAGALADPRGAAGG